MATTIKKYAGIQFASGKGPQDIKLLPDWANNSDLIVIPMPCCGRTFTYETIDEIPTETLPCPCGADWSWVIKYEEENP